ncbi:N-acetyltransferase [Novosphingobium mangrovi (ex Huang et al. 2023)]|uniref:N-acetyltransferase n=1 Tax=Novosphingobium mangrovi (ex Huang et al. 2023) TaxID=2976432 RepID=A0ABT2HZK4_9SPHN|nr:N-acetyltransferase [Novosphingobium mangrovi (ex Huang et al. 2023)]MCT2397984.1 N-acetyltransferase [Novosphingobium mangrovi (ex Huang et al. 2023)]
MANSELVITPVSSKADRAAFVDCAYRLNAADQNWVPNLRSEEISKFTPGKNPFFAHARCQLFLARRDGRIVGRISAHIDEQALKQPVEQGMGPGTGNWGAIEAEDGDTARALIETAENWLREQGMSRVLAPMNLSVWEEPGLQVQGHDHPPMVMMAHHNPAYQAWIEGAGYGRVKTLYTYDLDVTRQFPPLIQRIVASGEKNPKIRIRGADLNHFDRDAGIICDILNDAWSDNWGFVPFTPEEIAYTGKALKPLVHSELIRIAEYEGEPVAFMMTLPDLNQVQMRLNGRNGKPSILGLIKLLLWLRKPYPADMRVPLMGVRKKLQASRLASQLAFMMIEYIRRSATAKFGAKRGEIGWILEDNQGMVAIADAIDSKVNREYAIYEKAL